MAHYDTFTLTEFPAPVNSKEPPLEKLGTFTSYSYFFHDLSKFFRRIHKKHPCKKSSLSKLKKPGIAHRTIPGIFIES